MQPTNALEALAETIRRHGDLPAVRVSQAPIGPARFGPYFDAVRYSVTLTRDGAPTLRAEGRATRARRSARLAERDAWALQAAEGRILVQRPRGRLTEADAAGILAAAGVRVQ